MSQINKTQALEIFEQYPDIFWKTISLHFPFTLSEIFLYRDYLYWGGGAPPFDEEGAIYYPGTIEQGLFWNKNIQLNPEVFAIFNLTIHYKAMAPSEMDYLGNLTLGAIFSSCFQYGSNHQEFVDHYKNTVFEEMNSSFDSSQYKKSTEAGEYIGLTKDEYISLLQTEKLFNSEHYLDINLWKSTLKNIVDSKFIEDFNVNPSWINELDEDKINDHLQESLREKSWIYEEISKLYNNLESIKNDHPDIFDDSLPID